MLSGPGAFRHSFAKQPRKNLLGSSIYFDLRVVWGDEQGCEQLRRQILDQVADNRLFQRMMAENALRHRPPVGRFRDFVLSRKNGEKKPPST
nr:hypothetical protein GCM10020185_40560 [Pseudomonas brassicacearum subsp. brassicacearum]